MSNFTFIVLVMSFMLFFIECSSLYALKILSVINISRIKARWLLVIILGIINLSILVINLETTLNKTLQSLIRLKSLTNFEIFSLGMRAIYVKWRVEFIPSLWRILRTSWRTSSQTIFQWFWKKLVSNPSRPANFRWAIYLRAALTSSLIYLIFNLLFTTSKSRWV